MLADLASRDPERVIRAMWAVIALRDEAQLDALAAALPEIEQATAGLDLGGMLYSNDHTLAFALRKLRYHRDREGCLCGLYPEHLLFDPEREAAAGHVRPAGAGHWECAACGTRFHVEHGEAHWSWWQWTPSAPRRPAEP